MKIKFDSDTNLPLKKTLDFRNKIVIVRSAFYEDNKDYPYVCIKYNCKNMIGLRRPRKLMLTKLMVCVKVSFSINDSFVT